jgi:hypothetical protein
LGGGGVYATEERVCDDYSGTLTTPIWIDNDCDGQVNCGDNDCAVESGARGAPGGWTQYLGQGGSVCCTPSENLCKQFLDPQGTDAGVACGANNECDCLDVTEGAIRAGQDSATNPYKQVVVTEMTNYKTCVNKSTPYDRFINITEVRSGSTYIVTGRTHDINGGDDCGGDVNIGVYLNTRGPEPTIQLFSDRDSNGEVTASATYFVIAFSNMELVEDCLVSVTITQQ